MRIFYAVYNEGEEDSSLYETLIQMGHEVIRFDWGVPIYETATLYWQRKEKVKMNERCVAAVREAHRRKPVTLFFSYCYSSTISVETVRAIRQLGILTVNYTCNNMHQFELVKEIAPAYDFCMVPEEGALEFFRKANARPLHIQMAANPRFCHPVHCSREFDVTFVGQCYADRSEMVRFLCEKGIDIRVWGLGWRSSEPLAGLFSKLKFDRKRLKKLGKKLSSREGRATLWEANRLHFSGRKAVSMEALKAIPLDRRGGPLSLTEMVRMYSRSRISLGFLSLEPGGRKPIRQREFEAPMSGAFYLTEYLPELEHYYKIGKEIVCYQDKKDLVEKIRYYLDHPEEAERIRQAGYERALGEHTWEHRFQKLFHTVELSKRGPLDQRRG